MMQATLKIDRNAFLANRAQERMNAMQRAALQIIAGIYMDLLMKASKEEKQQASRRLCRLIERERLKGTNGHWSYDLNRHIALKQALDVLEGRTVRRRQMRHYC